MRQSSNSRLQDQNSVFSDNYQAPQQKNQQHQQQQQPTISMTNGGSLGRHISSNYNDRMSAASRNNDRPASKSSDSWWD